MGGGLTNVERGANPETAGRLCRERGDNQEKEEIGCFRAVPGTSFLIYVLEQEILHLSDFPEDGSDSA